MTTENASQNTTNSIPKANGVIVPGSYSARPTKDHGLAETKNGALRYEITFELLADGKPTGTTCKYSSGFEGEWEERTIEVLRTCGWTGTDIEKVGALTNEVNVKIKNREYNGRLYDEVQFVNPLRRAPAASKVTDFAAKLKAKLGGGEPAPAKPAAKTPWGAAKTG